MKTDNKILASLAAAALLLVLVVALSFWAFSQIDAAAAARKHTYEVVIRANALLSEIVDAETGQRGYALTGNQAFLAPYLAVRDGVKGRLEELRQLDSAKAAHEHLDALVPLLDAKLAELAQVIELRRNNDQKAVLALVAGGQGMRLMKSIRDEMSGFIAIESDALVRNDADLQSKMRQLFIIITTFCMFTLLFAVSFAYLIYRETQHRVKNLVHVETRHLLTAQQELNDRLQKANLVLQISEEKLAVTLNSIGDAVMTTDAKGRVTLLNPLAERLTGWTRAEAIDRPVEEIFRIINQETRKPSAIPVAATLAHGTVQGLANHTVLIARDGGESTIADSCAPIRDRDGQVVGAVLVFRDVTATRDAVCLARQHRADHGNSQYRGGRDHHLPCQRSHRRDSQPDRRRNVWLYRRGPDRTKPGLADTRA